MKRFIDHYKDENVATEYDAGRVIKRGNYFMIAYEMKGAEKTFSIGQPVYDRDNNLMGYLGIGLYENLDYSTEGKIRIPVECWIICLPTKHCVEGKRVYTYWQAIEPQAEGKGAEITLDKAIKICESNAEYEHTHGNLQDCLNFRQLAEWLKELKAYRAREEKAIRNRCPMV